MILERHVQVLDTSCDVLCYSSSPLSSLGQHRVGMLCCILAKLAMRLIANISGYLPLSRPELARQHWLWERCRHGTQAAADGAKRRPERSSGESCATLCSMHCCMGVLLKLCTGWRTQPEPGGRPPAHCFMIGFWPLSSCYEGTTGCPVLTVTFLAV